MPVKLKKGLDLNIAGAVESLEVTPVNVERCALIPDDYPGFTPRPSLKEGDAVAVGDALAYDKNHPELVLASPMAGILKAIVRGERRKILRLEVESDGTNRCRNFSFDLTSNPTALIRQLATTGLLAMIRTRPYDVVPNPEVRPRDIFVSCIDSAPLAVSSVSVAASDTAKAARMRASLGAGVKLLSAITEGKVYLSVDSSWPFGNIEGAEVVEFEGPHPSGNVSVQIEHIAPVNKGDLVWGLDFMTLVRIGEVVAHGVYDPRTVVAVAGPEVAKPGLLLTVIGAPIADLVKDRLAPADHHLRIISGNILTGEKVGTDDYLRYPYKAVTVIAEGDDRDEFMGWASVSPGKLSNSRSFPGRFLSRMFRPDARVLGGRRAMIMSGEYERMLPMDIMPEYLIKAILARDIEQMERLGIYEVAPEDFALAEYADTSKLPLQKIVREGLDYMRKELEG